MSKFKVGDTVRTTKDRDSSGTKLFPIGTIGTILESVHGSHMVKANGTYWHYTEDMIEPFKSYEDGLQDAWELANEINNMALGEVHKIYGFSIHREELFSAVDAQEALDKMEAYKKKQKICVGDVVEHKDGIKSVVMDTLEEQIAVFTENGCVELWLNKENVKKTGKNIDIGSLLKQIGGE